MTGGQQIYSTYEVHMPYALYICKGLRGDFWFHNLGIEQKGTNNKLSNTRTPLQKKEEILRVLEFQLWHSCWYIPIILR